MELNEPRAKKHCRLPQQLPLPVIFSNNNTWHKIKGVFNGNSVIVEDKNDMKNIIAMGYFGKANFSRSYPQFTHETKTEIIRSRQYIRRKSWSEKYKNKKIQKIIVVPDSDEERMDEYFVNLKPEYKLDQAGIRETVWLSLEEAFFLFYMITCLNIHQENKMLTVDEAWLIFSENNKYFQYDYVIYSHFRAKNWVVKPGIKFGGDYCKKNITFQIFNIYEFLFLVLYKEGPPFYHASYVVIIDIVNNNLERIQSLCRRTMDNVSLLGLNRLCETAGKELLIAQIILPEDDKVEVHYDNLTTFSVREILMRRWICTQENN